MWYIASSLISSFLAERGGSSIVSVRTRKRRSDRNVPSCTIFSRFLLVAAISRKSLSISRFAPTGRKRCSCSTPQERLLYRKGKLAYFIQKQRAAVGLLDETDLRPVRPGKCTLFMSEEHALHQCFRKGRAVDDDEIIFRARCCSHEWPSRKPPFPCPSRR